MSIVLNISVLSVTTRNVHRSYIIWMAQTRWESSSDRMEIMWHPAPLCNLNTKGLLDYCRGNCVSHSDSFFFTVFDCGCLVPIPRTKVIIELMAKINTSNNSKPHTKRAVTVNGVLLEVSVHFIGAFFMNNKYYRIRNHDLNQLLDRYQAY